MSLGKVTLLVIGLFMMGALAAPAMAVSYQNGWSYTSSPYGTYYSGSPYGGVGSLSGLGGGATDLSSIYGPSGPFGMGGLGGLGGLGTTYGYPSSYSPYMTYGYSPSTTGYSSPGTTDLGQVSPSSSSGNLFSKLGSNLGSNSIFGNMFGGSLLKPKTYGPPPTDAINSTLIGQELPYNSGYMGISIPYKIEQSDIGNVTGTQYKGQDAWKVRVGQPGMYWDVILDSAGKNILSQTQVQ